MGEITVKNRCPLVSVILPVYNVSRYLGTCLDSLLAQTYENFEAILVDDGSTDESLEICQRYAEKDSRFRVIHQENKGLASARNTGLRNYKGEYFYFIDSDDCIHPQLLEIVVAIAENEKANIVQINLKDVPADYKDFAREELVTKDEMNRLQHFSLAQALYNLDLDNQKFAKDIRLTTTVVWTKLYRSEAFKDFLFPEGMRMHEDQMVAHRLIQMGGAVVFVNLPLYFYRQSDASLIRVGWTPKRLAILDCYEDRLKCCEEVLADLENGKDISVNSLQIDEKNVVERTNTRDELISKHKCLNNYIYERYLVCCFRNYDMVSQKMTGRERQEEKKKILQRMKALLSSERGTLSGKKSLFFKLFVGMPDFIIWGFQMRNRILKK